MARKDPRELTLIELGDEVGDQKAVVADETGREKELKDECKRRKRKVIEGKRYRVTVSTVLRTVFDVAAAKIKCGAAWCKRHSKETEVIVVRVVARKRVA